MGSQESVIPGAHDVFFRGAGDDGASIRRKAQREGDRHSGEAAIRWIQ